MMGRVLVVVRTMLQGRRVSATGFTVLRWRAQYMAGVSGAAGVGTGPCVSGCGYGGAIRGGVILGGGLAAWFDGGAIVWGHGVREDWFGLMMPHSHAGGGSV